MGELLSVGEAGVFVCDPGSCRCLCVAGQVVEGSCTQTLGRRSFCRHRSLQGVDTDERIKGTHQPQPPILRSKQSKKKSCL